VAPTVDYYAGSSASGTPLSSPPSTAGTYTAVASFPGSADYTSASSAPATFIIYGPPAITTTIPDQTVATANTPTYQVQASDPNGLGLTYQISDPAGYANATITNTGGLITFSPTGGAAVDSVTVIVTNAVGLSTSQTFNVTIVCPLSVSITFSGLTGAYAADFNGTITLTGGSGGPYWMTSFADGMSAWFNTYNGGWALWLDTPSGVMAYYVSSASWDFSANLTLTMNYNSGALIGLPNTIDVVPVWS